MSAFASIRAACESPSSSAIVAANSGLSRRSNASRNELPHASRSMPSKLVVFGSAAGVPSGP
jgi:hypothetical protein